jgi:hypothetical protein
VVKATQHPPPSAGAAGGRGVLSPQGNRSRAHRIACVLLLLFLPPELHAQLREIHGILGGEFQRQDYTSALVGSTFSHYRQVANLTVLGDIYHRNVLDFSLSTRLLNSNTVTTNGGPTTRQHDVYFNLYDLSVNALGRTRFPVSFFVRRDISTNTVRRDPATEFSNKVLITSEGGRISYGTNNGSILPLMTFSIDNTDSESLTPEVPHDQTNRNIQLSFEKAIGAKTTVTLDLLHRTRRDRVANFQYITREAHLYGASQPNERNQISTTVNYFNERTLHSLRGNTLWSAQLTPTLHNQARGQVMWLTTPATTIVEGELQDRIDVELSPQWRTLAVLSHAERRTTAGGNRSERRVTSALGGITYRGETGRLLPTASMQAHFDQALGEYARRTIGGLISGAITTRGFSLGQVTIGDQIDINRTTGIVPQTLVHNAATLTIESTPVTNLYMHHGGSYNVTRALTGPAYNNRRDAAYLFDASYLWTRGMTVLLTAGYALNWAWTEYYSSTLNRYSAELSFPNILRNLTAQVRWIRTNDGFQRGAETVVDASSTYTWRSLAFRLRYIRYAFVMYRRSDIEFSVTRPFSISFER